MMIEQQLNRLARDIANANRMKATPKLGEALRNMASVERRAQSVARDVAEQLGATLEAGEDEIDAALELVLQRLLSPAPIELLAA
jgi:hypothetical protein